MWLLLLVGLFGAVMVATSIVQYRSWRNVNFQLAEVKNQKPEADRAFTEEKEVDLQLKAARSTATLYTYLKHPWPRTRVLAAIVEPLPKTITLAEMRITTEEPRLTAAEKRRLRLLGKEEDEEALAALLPSERDLKQLRDTIDKSTTVVYLVGITRQGGALHGYLSELTKSDLFAKAEIRSIESIESSDEDVDTSEQSRFSVRLTLKPGYSKPNTRQPTQEEPVLET